MLDIDAAKYTVAAARKTAALGSVNLCTADAFRQMLNNPKTRAKAFAVRVSSVEEPTSCSLMHAGTGHPLLSSWLSSLAPHLSYSTC